LKNTYIINILLTFITFSCNRNITEEVKTPIDKIGTDFVFTNRKICKQIYEIHSNGQTKDLRMIFDDTTMVWKFDSTGINLSTETHVNNKLMSATFFNKNGTIAEEQKYLLNDTINDLHWATFYYEDNVTIEGLTGNDKYWGDWYIKYPNDTIEIMNYGQNAKNKNITDTLQVFYQDTLIGLKIKNKNGEHIFYKM